MLLLAQALGLHHGVAHGVGVGHGSAGPESSLSPRLVFDHPGPVERGHAHGINQGGPLANTDAPAGAFHADHAAGDAQCRLVDQLGHLELVWLALPSTSVLPPDRPAAGGRAPASLPDTAWSPGQARGPP